MLDDAPIGDIVLKNNDFDAGCCTMGIYLQNESCRNQGYGTEAERMTLEYAFYKKQDSGRLIGMTHLFIIGAKN